MYKKCIIKLDIKVKVREGLGSSQMIKPKRKEDIILGEVIIESNELKLITDDGEVHIYN